MVTGFIVPILHTRSSACSIWLGQSSSWVMTITEAPGQRVIPVPHALIVINATRVGCSELAMSAMACLN